MRTPRARSSLRSTAEQDVLECRGDRSGARVAPPGADRCRRGRARHRARNGAQLDARPLSPGPRPRRAPAKARDRAHGRDARVGAPRPVCAVPRRGRSVARALRLRPKFAALPWRGGQGRCRGTTRTRGWSRRRPRDRTTGRRVVPAGGSSVPVGYDRHADCHSLRADFGRSSRACVREDPIEEEASLERSPSGVTS